MDLMANPAGRLVLEAHRPLYERVPTRDTDGKLLSDFMVLIPGLRNRPQQQFAETLARLQTVLSQFAEVVFVDLNVPLNLLWVSVRPRPKVILDIAAAILVHVPEARLVADRRA
jgi:hypothetical protein